jgi:hypothetical protein
MSITEKDIMRIVLKAPNPESLAKFVKELRLGIGNRPRRLPDGTLSMEAFATEEVLDKLKKAGGVFDIIENATEVGKARLNEVGKGDRFEGGKKVPSGLGKKE